MKTKAKPHIFLLLLLVLLSVGLLTACGKTAAEKTAEMVIKDATGADVNIDGEQMEITGEDGEKITVGGDIAWPKDKLGDLPELPGKIETFLESGEIGGTLFCVGTTKQQIEAFIEGVKDLGYTENAYQGEDTDGMITYYAGNGSFTVSLNFYPEGGSGPNESSCTLTYSKAN